MKDAMDAKVRIAEIKKEMYEIGIKALDKSHSPALNGYADALRSLAAGLQHSYRQTPQGKSLQKAKQIAAEVRSRKPEMQVKKINQQEQ
jgi:hypothetical protein